MGKRRQIPASFKQRVIEYIETNKCTAHAAYVHFSKTEKVDYKEGMYYQWYKNKDDIMDLAKGKKRLYFMTWKKYCSTKSLKCTLDR